MTEGNALSSSSQLASTLRASEQIKAIERLLNTPQSGAAARLMQQFCEEYQVGLQVRFDGHWMVDVVGLDNSPPYL